MDQLLERHGKNRICEWSAQNGRLDILQWARENKCPWDEYTCSCAALGGHLYIIKWARENGCPWNELTCLYAALGGHLHIVEWAIRKGCPKSLYLQIYFPLSFKYTFLFPSKRLLQYNVFDSKQPIVKEWIKEVEAVCNYLSYDDLSYLIKNFI